MSVGFFEIVFACNARTTLEECFGYLPSEMWGAMSSFDDILRCVEKWRLYNEQTVKQ